MWDIRWSKAFEAEVDNLGLSVKRLDAVLWTTDWALHRAPTFFPAIPGTSLRLMPIDPFPEVPALRIYYRIEDDHIVELEWIEPVTEDLSEPID